MDDKLIRGAAGRCLMETMMMKEAQAAIEAIKKRQDDLMIIGHLAGPLSRC